MSEQTGVDWADSAWPVTTGCTKVSLGCDNCYALRGSWRMSHNPNPKVREAYEGTAAKREDGTLDWTGAVRECHNRLDWPGKWRKPKRVFVCSMSDLFHSRVSGCFINEVWNEMYNVKRHTYIVLTKRPERLRSWTKTAAAAKHWPEEEIWPNWMWLGVTAEDQRRADERIPRLLSVPAAVRWVSVEPMLGPVELWPWLSSGSLAQFDTRAPDWIVVGAETGPNARPAKREWVTDLIDQCRAAGVKVFVKDNIPNGWLEPYGVSHLREYPEVKP